jgi:CubicO group peptidase (beta-lactamase class C family)
MTLFRLISRFMLFLSGLMWIPQLLAQQSASQIPSAIHGLGSKDPMVRVAAIKAVAKFGSDAVPLLARALKDTNELLRENAAVALGDIGPDAKAAIEDLLRCLSDSSLFVSGKAANALSRIGDAAVPGLINALTAGNARSRQSAAIALAKLGTGAAPAIQLLIQSLNDSSEILRWCSAVALGNIGEAAHTAVPALLTGLSDRDQGVRSGCALALARIDPKATEDNKDWRRAVAIIGELVPRLMTETRVPGVAIALISKGAVVWSTQYGIANVRTGEPVTRGTLFEACSMSKPIFAYLAMKLVEDGRLDLDKPLATYLTLPSLQGQPGHETITARMVLSHTTGLPNWRKGGEEQDGPLPVTFTPGSRFGYSGEGFFYLQQVVERITGMPLESYAERMLFNPLGLRHVGYSWTEEIEPQLAAGHDTNGAFLQKTKYVHPNAAYSLYTSAEDYAALLVEMLNPVRMADHFLRRRILDTMLTRQVSVESREPVERPGKARGIAAYWALGWCINATSEGDIYHHSGSNGSGFRCFCQFNPATGSGIVIMTNGLGGGDLLTRVIARIGDL